jgi:hypothetical protein
MVVTEVGPQLVPGGKSFAHQQRIAVLSAIGAADHAMLIAGGGKRIGNLPLLEQRHLVAAPGHGPGGA